MNTETHDELPIASNAGDPMDRFLSQERCAEVVQRLVSFATGGGTTTAYIESTWQGNLRWARNQISTSGDIRNTPIIVQRTIHGASAKSKFNQLVDSEMRVAVQHAERLLVFAAEATLADLPQEKISETHAKPDIWSEVTYTLDADTRAEVMRGLVKPAEDAGMLAAGYLQVSAHGRSVMSSDGTMLYYPYTKAQYSVTVRDPEGNGSGWAGVDWHDWKRIDAGKLSAIALDKCLRSRNPVRVEPGRYTAILEPQAVADLVCCAFFPSTIDRRMAESPGEPDTYSFGDGNSKIETQIFGDQVTVRQDCMDPELGFPPFSEDGQLYYPVTWVQNGVLKQLGHNREYAVQKLGKPTGTPASGAFRIDGGTTSIDDMIATTKRGLLVTRFSLVTIVDPPSLLCTGYTRDGLWLIENGKITKAVHNFRFTESPAFVLNNIEQLGVAQRVFSEYAPIVVPSMKVRDFSFTSLSDAI